MPPASPRSQILQTWHAYRTALVQRGQVLEQQRQAREALSAEWRAAVQNTQQEYLRAARHELCDVLCCQAQACLRRWQYAQAEAYIRKVLELEPDHPGARKLAERLPQRRLRSIDWLGLSLILTICGGMLTSITFFILLGCLVFWQPSGISLPLFILGIVLLLGGDALVRFRH